MGDLMKQKDSFFKKVWNKLKGKKVINPESIVFLEKGCGKSAEEISSANYTIWKNLPEELKNNKDVVVRAIRGCAFNSEMVLNIWNHLLNDNKTLYFCDVIKSCKDDINVIRVIWDRLKFIKGFSKEQENEVKQLLEGIIDKYGKKDVINVSQIWNDTPSKWREKREDLLETLLKNSKENPNVIFNLWLLASNDFKNNNSSLLKNCTEHWRENPDKYNNKNEVEIMPLIWANTPNKTRTERLDILEDLIYCCNSSPIAMERLWDHTPLDIKMYNDEISNLFRRSAFPKNEGTVFGPDEYIK